MAQAAISIAPSLTEQKRVEERIRAIDLLRGLVILIMALDHVRDFWSVTGFAPEDVTQTTIGFFFTRWITHFCAPVFVFLSGTSAYLYALKRQCSRNELARFLLTRGLWLIVVEVTWVTLSWQFGYSFFILQVIWAIGWSMIFLAGFIYLPRSAILAVGILAVAGHNLLDGISAQSLGAWSWLWMFWHEQNFYPFSLGGIQGAFFGYPILPWFGVMALGYWIGPWFSLAQSERVHRFTLLGLGLTSAFLLLRGLNAYGNPAPWLADQRGPLWNLMAVLNTQKYPPSLHYLLMTLGPALMLLPRLESWRGRLADWVMCFGKVPFFFYLLHLPVIHLSSVIWQYSMYGATVNGFIPPSQFPAGYSPNLVLCYLAWLGTICVLYWPCRWFVGIRRRYSYWWLSYL